jgi:hypothetical protein
VARVIPASGPAAPWAGNNGETTSGPAEPQISGTKTYEYAREQGVDVTLKILTEDETGAEHCQHDNPTLGMERMADWLAEVFQIDERQLLLT